MRQVSGSFNVTNVVEIGGNPNGPWTVDGSFFDNNGIWGPGDVQPGMLLFTFDPIAGTVRYSIDSITTSSNPMEIVVSWDDQGTPIDPDFGAGAICALNYISGSCEEPSYTEQSLDEGFVSGIRSQTNRSPLEKFGWKRFDFLFSDFAISANSNSLTLFSLPSNVILEKVIVKHTTAFSGGALSAYTVEVGLSDNLNKYVDPFDVFQAVAEDAQITSTVDQVEDFDNPTTVVITANSTGDTLDDATAGEVFVLVKLGDIQN